MLYVFFPSLWGYLRENHIIYWKERRSTIIIISTGKPKITLFIMLSIIFLFRRLHILILRKRCLENLSVKLISLVSSLVWIAPIEYLEWPCTVNSRLASWTIPDLFLSREKYRCRAEIDHFTNQLLNLQGFISVGGECLEIQMQEE